MTSSITTQNREYLWNKKKIFQKGKRHSSLLWKAFQISSNRPFARSGQMVRNKLCWDASYAVGWTGTSSFVLEVPLCDLRPSIIYSVPCDRIVQRAYYFCFIGYWDVGRDHAVKLFLVCHVALFILLFAVESTVSFSGIFFCTQGNNNWLTYWTLKAYYTMLLQTFKCWVTVLLFGARDHL